MISETERAEAIGHIRSLVALAGGSCQVVRLTLPDYSEAEAQILGTTFKFAIGPERAWGRFKSPTETRWGSERRTVDEYADGPLGLWLVWASMGISLAGGRTPS